MKTNHIYNEDCLTTLGRMPSDSIDLVVTSPPYNKNHWLQNRSENNGGRRVIAYDSLTDDMPHDQYVQQQKQVIQECLRVLKPTGSLFYNHMDILHKHLTIHPKYIYDFPVKQVLIWNRTNTPKLDNSYFLPVTEWIFWVKKTADATPIFHRNRMPFRKNIIQIPPATKNDHPAPFPLALANTFILGCTEPGAVVFDPYIGSGTTAIACVLNDRKYIGSEISAAYHADSCQRIKEHQSQHLLPFA